MPADRRPTPRGTPRPRRRAWLTAFALLHATAAVALDDTAIDLGDGNEIQAHRAAATAPTGTLIWLLSEHGMTAGVARLADDLAALGVDTWLLDPFQTWFLPVAPSSLADYDREALAAAVHRIAADGAGPVFLASNDRAGGVLLELAQRLPASEVRGALLISPNLYTQTPAPGEEARFLPAVAQDRLPLYLFVPRQSTLAIRMADIQRHAGATGAPVWVEALDAVRDRFFFRPDASAEEDALSGRFAARMARAMGLLDRAPRHAPIDVAPIAAPNSDTHPGQPRVLRPHRGDPTPPSLRHADLAGTEHDLAALRGRVVLVNFWASWCPPCVHEMPSMARLQSHYPPSDFRILAVNLGESRPAIEAFLAEHPVNFPVLLDPEQREPRRWRVFAFPTSYLIDRRGAIRHAVAGGLEWDAAEIFTVIDELLAEHP